MKSIPVGKLIFDYNIYPRAAIDDQYVSYLVDALKAGSEFPPLIAENKTLRIVDGFNRAQAYLKWKGPAHEVEVILQSYKDDGDLMLDAMRYNAHHGRRMSVFDMAHAALKAEDFGATRDSIAAVLSIRVERLDQILSHRSADARSRQATAVLGESDQEIAEASLGKPGRIALKNTIRHLAGRTLTKEQQKANRRLGGMNQGFYVNQLLLLLRNDMFDYDNEALVLRLLELGELIKAVKRKAA